MSEPATPWRGEKQRSGGSPSLQAEGGGHEPLCLNHIINNVVYYFGGKSPSFRVGMKIEKLI